MWTFKFMGDKTWHWMSSNLIGNISLFSHDTQAVTSIRLNSSLVARAHFQTVRLSSRRSRWSEITRETITSSEEKLKTKNYVKLDGKNSIIFWWRCTNSVLNSTLQLYRVISNSIYLVDKKTGHITIHFHVILLIFLGFVANIKAMQDNSSLYFFWALRKE